MSISEPKDYFPCKNIHQKLPGNMHQLHMLFQIPNLETQQSFAQERPHVELHPLVTEKRGLMVSTFYYKTGPAVPGCRDPSPDFDRIRSQ